MSDNQIQREPIRREFNFSNVARFKWPFMDSYLHDNPSYKEIMKNAEHKRAFGNAIFYYRNKKELQPSGIPVLGKHLPDLSMHRVGRHLALFGAMTMVSLVFLPHQAIEVGLGVAAMGLGVLVKYAGAHLFNSDKAALQNAFANCYSKAQEVYEVPADASNADKVAAFEKLLEDPDYAEWVGNAKEHAEHHSGSSRYGNVLINVGATIATTGFLGGIMETLVAVSTLVAGGVLEYLDTKDAVDRAYSAVFGDRYGSRRDANTQSGPAILDPK
ncbi:MAG: hypothetical protein CMH32_05200 [Micavibrio sp.]|nr:hypothetical protein [Micavibrio sp.]HCK32844.1 hypothetical protein [Rhodospirillaceae bacterium]|tara:strand:- start:731 stop:1546 length:816 start_codon:yes stop_codon:yes gene_type:complete